MYNNNFEEIKEEKELDTMIQLLHSRLRWLTFQETEENIDVEELWEILHLLDMIDPLPSDLFNIQQSWENFEEYCKERDEEME